MPQSDPPSPESWHLDKRVPVALIATLILQILAFGALYGRLEQRVTHVEDASKLQASALSAVPERLARLEVLLERIERELKRADGRQPGNGR